MTASKGRKKNHSWNNGFCGRANETTYRWSSSPVRAGIRVRRAAAWTNGRWWWSTWACRACRRRRWCADWDWWCDTYRTLLWIRCRWCTFRRPPRACPACTRDKWCWPGRIRTECCSCWRRWCGPCCLSGICEQKKFDIESFDSDCPACVGGAMPRGASRIANKANG